MKFVRNLVLNLIISIVLLCLLNLSSICCSLNITIIHNNDFHTHFEPINVWSNPCKTNETCFGGIARTVTKVNEIHNEMEGKNVLFLNAGDHFQGTIWYTFEKWKVVAEFVKLMRHDVMALGNHEFDDGVDGEDGLLYFIKNMTQNNEKNLPIVCCNIETSGELKQLIKSSVVVEMSSHNIAIIGYITPDTTFLSRPGNTIKFHDEIESIDREIKNLKNQYGDTLNIFIALGHSGFEKDKEIATKIPELDIVVGGHTNTFLYTGDKPSIEEPEGEYPLVFDHQNDGKTLYVQAFAYGKYLGKLDVVFDDNGVVISYGGNPILLDESVSEDSLVLSKVLEKSKEIDLQFNEDIGLSLVHLDALKCREQECNTGNMFADSFVSYFVDKTLNRQQGWTSVAMALVNGGAIRSGIGIGNITTKDVVSASPFGNFIGNLRVKGSLLWQILEHSASQYKMGGFLQVSGIRYEFDSNKTIGQRLRSVRVRCSQCITPSYEDLDVDQNYNIVVTEYLVNGGDNYTMINSSDFTQFQEIDYLIVSSYVQKYSPILTGLEDRIINAKSVDQGDCSNQNQNSYAIHIESTKNCYNIIVFICFLQVFNYLLTFS